MKKLLILAFCAICFQCLGQTRQSPEYAHHGQDKNSDSLIAREMAQFTSKALGEGKAPLNAGVKLVPLRLMECSENYVHLKYGKRYSAGVHVFFDGQSVNGITKLKAIRFINIKYSHVLPDSVVLDLERPVFCKFDSARGNRQITDCKAFISPQSYRVYIYMLNGEGSNKYEVTWIIENSKFKSRIINRL